MAVFRLYNIQGNNNIVDWQVSQVYGTQAIGEISDPDGATAKKEITSIPSPFARIDLVKTAFREVTNMVRGGRDKKAALNGITIYHKMVSEMFDVAQLFFNFNRFKDKFEILVWDRDRDLDVNNILGNTLKLYLESDAKGNDPYNFGKMRRIYLLNYIGPDRPSDMNIVGGTSPTTLFFSSANSLSYVSRNVMFDTDRPFDDGFSPLYKRSFDFQKYMFALRKSNRRFATEFPEVNDYLDLTYGCLSNDEKSEIDRLTETTINDYEPIGVGERGQDFLEILGHPFHKISQAPNWDSDFKIRTSIYSGDKLPFVLPIEKGNVYANYVYTSSVWGQENAAPYVALDSNKKVIPWKQRRLPKVNDEYPFLTISDFLEDVVIRLPYKQNSDDYFDGGYVCRDENEKCSYLLPLTDLFFQFFSVKELKETIPGTNKKMLEFVENVGGVKVLLRVPVKKGFIEYSRIYYKDASPDVSEKKNDGGLIETKFGLGIMPFVRFPDDVDKHYRVAFYDKGKSNTTLSFRDLNNNNDLVTNRVPRAEKGVSGCSHEAYVVESNFDRIKVRMGQYGGYIVPKFQKVNETNGTFTFAVDFGTTNTHIEYCTDANKTPKAFDVKKDEKQIHKMHEFYDDPDIRIAFEQDFIPDTIGDKYNFPMRTVFASRKGMKLENNPMPLSDGNIPFLYEKDIMPIWDTINTELKWGSVSERLLEMHLETLFILMRNKVAINNGNLSATRVIWFYPASMTVAKVNQFNRIWKDAYEKYFGSNSQNNVISISESKAPYLHFISSQGAADEIVTIDIGGGTTDVFVVEEQNDRMLLSFRFASNAIFGDAYNSNPQKNGFVCKYKDDFKKKLDSNGLLELSQALTQIEAQGKSSDIVAFLFSLVGDKVKSNKELDFLRKLKGDDRMRYVFIIFYGSILYFLAKAMKAKGLVKPKTIAFSGNGAKTLHILSEEDSMVARFAKLIFDGVYGDSTGTIEVMMEKNPKIATCKGGIERPNAQPYDQIGNIKTIFVGNDFASTNDEKLTYANITDSIKNEVVESVKDFFVFLFELHKNNNEFLINNLAADSSIFNEVKEFCLGDEGMQLLQVSMSKGIANKRDTDGVNDETQLEETLFFYPLVGFLHNLAYKIYKM
jgi:hypothetical protein